MATLQDLQNENDKADGHDSDSQMYEQLIEWLEHQREKLKNAAPAEISSLESGKEYIESLKKFRETVARILENNGKNYPELLKSILSVGEDGLYSNELRFMFELIQNVDDCDFDDVADCKLDMRFDFNNDEIILTYNELGFTPFNVFAITGIAEEAKNILSGKNQIGEKGIGFKSVFGVAYKVWIKSGWFSFELYKENYTIPIPSYDSFNYYSGTQMILYVPGKARKIYNDIKDRYCKKDSLFSQNPLLFLNKLTSLKIYFDAFRSMEFYVSRNKNKKPEQFIIENNIEISVDLHHHDSSSHKDIKKTRILCTRYTYHVVFSKEACRARYGDNTKVGQENGKAITLSAVVPNAEFLTEIGNGALYSFLPTQIKMTVPIVIHVPFKLDASREFVDPQDDNLWFQEASQYLSELMDRVYLNYCKTAKEDIHMYLPGKKESLFANNNGKERCLTKQDIFTGEHYLSLPILYTIDGEYKKAAEVFCFGNNEKLTEPERVYRLMGYPLSLFNASITDNKFAIEIKTKVKDEMFKKALASADKTNEILDYLDSVNYEYTENLISQIAPIKISLAQVCTILKHSKLADLLKKICCDEIKKNKRFKLEITDASEQIITDIFGDEFEVSDVPKKVSQYIQYCNKKCILVDEPNDIYLPCYNAIIISAQKPSSSFTSFCREIEPNDPFTTRISWRENSNKLNEYVEDSTISENEYMRKLRQIRLAIKESLGEEGYHSYLDIILKSGTDKGRFIQELIQNADDCQYEQNVPPSFFLYLKNQTIITEYNEKGFTRANIRSITAIGESTKKKLLSDQSTPIGEKGVGFKTIFAIASKVTIHSGNYHFWLSNKEPTIPKNLDEANLKTVLGTRMEIQLTNSELYSDYKEKDILELCLCLRKLKNLTIGKYEVTIGDTEDKRTIKIGKHEHVFKRFNHNFTITNDDALEERKNGNREISTEQQIICYVPEGTDSDFPLYCGLPTKHKIKIPIAIDAPFSLTTSREEIETEGSAWNDIVRKEMYSSILEVIDSLKKDDRSKIFRFFQFDPRRQGNVTIYVNNTFDNEYLNAYDLLSQLCAKEILPTYKNDFFAIPCQQNAYRFPKFMNFVFSRLPSFEYDNIDTSTIIDIGDNDNDKNDKALNALKCEEADFSVVFPIIYNYSERFIKEESFRKDLYDYLQKTQDDCRDKLQNDYSEKLKDLKIIPVFGQKNNSTEYISWQNNSIFVKPNTFNSEDDYYVLDEKLMSKSVCEKIYSANINEMNKEWERNLYISKLEEKICGEDIVSIYNYLISEYRCGKLLKYDSFGILLANGIPLKNQLGNIIRNNLFVCDQSGYFTTEMINGITVHDECRGLANDIKIKSLKDIHYEDIQYNEELTEDDIEVLIDEPDHYFEHYEEILRGFYRDGLLTDDLLQKYKLDYIAFGNYDESDYCYDFPSEPVGNRNALVSHIKNICNDAPKIITKEEMRKVQKIKTSDGKLYSYDLNYSRNTILKRYSPEERNDLCICQMCRKPKNKKYIEVNNIESLPEYFFDQLRIALCLECSKEFEALRRNDSIREKFLREIRECDIDDEYDEYIEIPIKNKEITFTAKHLAEIQEILKQKPKSEINKPLNI